MIILENMRSASIYPNELGFYTAFYPN